MAEKDESKEHNLLAGGLESASEVSVAEVSEVAPETDAEQPETSREVEGTAEPAEDVQEQSEATESQEVHEEPVSAQAPADVPVPAKDPILKGIEEILSEDLTDLYLSLPDEKKPEFKARGEEVAITVKKMIDDGKVRVRKVLDLIRGWLQLVPGVSRFFLEQEAKIKTDKLSQFIEDQSSNNDL